MIENSSNLRNSYVSRDSFFNNASISRARLGEGNKVSNSLVADSATGKDVVIGNMNIFHSWLNGRASATASGLQKNLHFSTISSGVELKNSRVGNSSVASGSIIENAEIENTNLRGNSKVVDSGVVSTDYVRRTIQGLDITGNSYLAHGGSIGASVKINDSEVKATKIESSVTINNGSKVSYYTGAGGEPIEGQKMEIGSFSTLSGANISNSNLLSSVEVTDSEVRSSSLGHGAKVLNTSTVKDSILEDGAEVLDHSDVLFSSTLKAGTTVQSFSEILRATIASNISVGQSLLTDVSISEDKQNNYCNSENVSEPKIIVDDDGDETENPCYNPIYTPEE